MTNQLEYRGIRKHKNWRPGGGFGTICPEWTHRTAEGGFAGDPYAHPWPTTEAQRLLNKSYQVGAKRYSAARGIAFCAQESRDGTWHGYPIPWVGVPHDAYLWLIKNGLAGKRDRKRQKTPQDNDLYWALSTDD